MKKGLYKSLAALLVFTQLIFPVEYSAREIGKEKLKEDIKISVEDTKEADVGHQQIADISSTKKEKQEKNEKRELKASFKEKKHDAKEKIKIVFDNKDVKKYRYETKGVEVVEQNPDTMEFDVLPTEEFGQIDVYAEYEDEEIVKSSVYTYVEDEMTFLSDMSMDMAWYNCKEYQVEQGEITQEEMDEEYSKFSQRFWGDGSVIYEPPVKETDSSVENGKSYSVGTAAATTCVKGTLQWETETGAKLPFRYAKIELRDKDVIGSEVIATTYTDVYGNYTFTFSNSAWFENGGLDVFVRTYLESDTLNVIPITGYHYLDSKIMENIKSGSTVTVNGCFAYDEDSITTSAAYVFQGMLVGERFAEKMGFNTNTYVHVFYPIPIENWDHEAGCTGVHPFYGAAIGKDRFKDIDTLIHEYGHFVQHELGIYGCDYLEMYENDPTHVPDKDHFSDKPDKEYAMELTWSEAWASAFSLLAQEYYAGQYKGISGFADIKIYDINYETYETLPASGEAQEDAVTAMLWDLYDAYSSKESFDNVSWGYQKWWSRTTIKGTYTLTHFSVFMSNYYPKERGDIGAIMAKYQISPGNLTITNKSSVSTSTAPKLEWYVNGSINNPNNAFKVMIFNKEGALLAETSQISSTKANSDTYVYQIPQTTWNKVVNAYDGSFSVNIAVCAYNTKKTPISGPYYSQYVTVNIQKSNGIALGNYDRYRESIVKIAPEGWVDYNISVGTSGYRIFQTFGTIDTMIQLYDSSGNLLVSNDDGGYNRNALGYYYLSSGTTYKLRVKGYGSVFGTTKVAITPATGALASSASTIKEYESIKQVSGYKNYTWTTYASLNYARVMLYTPPSTGNYTLEITSEFDTYMYVIDPRSTTAIKSGTNYDDDSGEGLNPKMTVKLEKGIPYMIVYSGYNLSSNSATGTLVLKISKN